MKKYIVILCLFFIFGAALPGVACASGGFLKPTSSFYFLQSWKESLGLFFSFSKESKLEYLQKLNNKKISELQYDVNNDSEIAKMLAEKYENNYKKIEKLATETKDKKQIVEKIEADSLVQQEVLAQVYSQVSQQAQEAILNAQINSSKNVSAVLEKVSPEKAQEYFQEVQQIQQAQKLKMMEKIPMAEKEAGNNGGSPEDRDPKSLNIIKESKELNQINSINDADDIEDQGLQGGVNQMQPVQSAPMQSSAVQN